VRSATKCIARCLHQHQRRRRRRRRRRASTGDGGGGRERRGGRRDGRCVAVDFDTANSTCWLHSTTTGCAGDRALLPLASSVHYRVRRHACHNLSQSLYRASIQVRILTRLLSQFAPPDTTRTRPSSCIVSGAANWLVNFYQLDS